MTLERLKKNLRKIIEGIDCECVSGIIHSFIHYSQLYDVYHRV